MIHPFRFALQAMDLGSRDQVAETARLAEDLGYSELYSYDHIGEVDPFAPLIVAAEATTELRVGPLVLNNELHHSVLLARTAATVDRMTDGRLVLGIGTGYAQGEHDAAGIALGPPGQRVTRLDESARLLRSLLDNGAATGAGHDHVAIDDLGVRPIQERVPFLIGGHGRRLVSVAAKHADVFQFTGLTHGPDGSPSPGGFARSEVTERERWLKEAAGKRFDRIELSALVQDTRIGAGADDAASAAAKRIGGAHDLVDNTPVLALRQRGTGDREAHCATGGDRHQPLRGPRRERLRPHRRRPGFDLRRQIRPRRQSWMSPRRLR